MPATQRGSTYKLGPGKWGLRFYDRDGVRRRKSPFPTKSAALAHYREVIEPEVRGESRPADYTLAEFVPVFLERHGADVRERTIETLRERLAVAKRRFGSVRLRELEAMTGEMATWYAELPERSRFAYMAALRQALGAAVRWHLMGSNPAVIAVKNRQPPPRTIRTYTVAELDAIGQELSAIYRGLPAFAAATGLRPEEWAALERKDIDRKAGLITVARTVTGGKSTPIEVLELAKTDGSRREVPLTPRALAALELATPRIGLIFPAPEGGPLNLDNFRRRQWAPAIEASGVERPARIYDLRSTFASDSLAAGITVFELGRVMGTSIRMLERHYGRLLGGAGASIAARLAAYHAAQQEDTGLSQQR